LIGVRDVPDGRVPTPGLALIMKRGRGVALSELVIGVDAHKRSHTLVAVDGVGRKLAERSVGTASEDHLTVVKCAGQWSGVRFALEDPRHLTRRLERDLLAAGQAVVRVPTHVMAAARRGGRQPGKSDPIDALAVAQATLREPSLPLAR
jgi:transposase